MTVLETKNSTTIHTSCIPNSAPLGLGLARLSCPPNPAQIWLLECKDDALSLIERRAAAFRNGEFSGTNPQDAADRAKRYQLIDTLLSAPTTVSGKPGCELLREIVAGYLHEFSRQTILGVPPLNIANPSRPQPGAKAYWESCPPELFERHRLPGVHHTAVSYHQLLQEHYNIRGNDGSTTGRKAAWDATSEVVRASIDTFRARGDEIFPSRELRASIYNDHIYVIAYARKASVSDGRSSRPVA
jgi:hypothetical protein